MKIKKIITPRALKRFKTMAVAGLLVGAMSFMTDNTVSNVLSFQLGDSEFSGLFVNAEEGVTEDGPEPTSTSSEVVLMQYSNGYIELLSGFDDDDICTR